MKLRNIRYYLKESINSILRNRLMSMASVLTVASCIFILSVSFVILINIDYFLEQLQNTVGLSLLLEDSLSADEVNELRVQILKIDHIEEVVYISSAENFEEFSGGLDDDSYILDALWDDNPLPRSFNISLDDNKYQADVISKLEGFKDQGVYKIRHELEVVDMLISINNAIRITAVVVFLLLAFVSVIIIMNTIKLTVNSRRIEINIMKYVGATDWFIRWPFVIEGLLIGLIGASIPLLIFWLSYERMVVSIGDNLPLIRNIVEFREAYVIFAFLVPFTLIGGSMLGSIGSIIAVRRHLKV